MLHKRVLKGETGEKRLRKGFPVFYGKEIYILSRKNVMLLRIAMKKSIMTLGKYEFSYLVMKFRKT